VEGRRCEPQDLEFRDVFSDEVSVEAKLGNEMPYLQYLVFAARICEVAKVCYCATGAFETEPSPALVVFDLLFL